MSKRILGGIGRGIHELGSSIEGRNAAAAKQAFEERKASIAHNRRIVLEELRNTHATGRVTLSDKLARGRNDQTHGQRMDEREFTAGRSDTRAARSDANALARQGSTQAHQLALEGVRTKHRRGEAEYTAGLRDPELEVDESGVQYAVNPRDGTARPVMKPGGVKPGVVPSDLDHPGRQGEQYTGIVPPQPFKPQAKAQRTGTVPREIQLAEALHRVDPKRYPTQAEAYQAVLNMGRTAKSNPMAALKTAMEIAAAEMGVTLDLMGPEDGAMIKSRAEQLVREMIGGGGGAPSGPAMPRGGGIAAGAQRAGTGGGGGTYRYVPGQGLVAQ